MMKLLNIVFICVIISSRLFSFDEDFEDIDPYEEPYQEVFEEELNQIVAEELSKQALSYAEKKKYRKSIQIFENLHKKDPYNREYMYQLGRIYSYLKNWKMSEKYLKLCLTKNEEDVDARMALARMYYWKKALKKAKRELELVLEQQPKNLGAISLMGQINLFEVKYFQAKRFLKEAVDQGYKDKYTIYHLINAKLYADPSAKVSGGYAEEEEKDILLQKKTVKIEYVNAACSVVVPVNNYLRPNIRFRHASEKQFNLIVKRNNYFVHNYIYSMGMDVSINRYLSTKSWFGRTGN